MGTKRIVFQAALSAEDMRKFKENCAHKEVNMTEAFRAWIRHTNRQIQAAKK